MIFNLLIPDANYLSDALHIWAENTPVDEHNQRKLESIQSPLIILKAKDQYPKNVNKQDIGMRTIRNWWTAI